MTDDQSLTPWRQPLNILLVEDDDGDAKALQRGFQKAQIANPIQRVVDGIEALEYLRGENNRKKLPLPRVLLVDLNMPRMNGIELLRAIRNDRSLHQSVVFMLTTSKRDEDKTAAYSLNVSGYIHKETAGADFRKVVGLLASFWQIVELPN